MCLIVFYYCKKIKDQKNCIMKTKGSFVKVMLLNEVDKHFFVQSKSLILEIFKTHFIFFNIHINK
jgi:hypothetical protein